MSKKKRSSEANLRKRKETYKDEDKSEGETREKHKLE